MPTGDIEVLAEDVEVFNVCRKLPFEIKDFVKVSGRTSLLTLFTSIICHLFCCPEIRIVTHAVPLPGPEVFSLAEEPPTEVSTRDEDERIPL